MFITALFLIAKIWEQCMYPSMHKWIKKSCEYIYVHNGILFSHKNE